MSSSESLTSPPLDFTVYGLARSYEGTRWLNFFEGRIGDPAWALWLGHRIEDSGLLVGTLPRGRYDEGHCASGADCLAQVAFTASFKAVNLALPEPEVARPAGAETIFVDHALWQSQQYADWPTVPWIVDGREVVASVWQFAGVWAAFTNDLPDCYLVVLGVGGDPDNLLLTRVDDGVAYGMDLAGRLNLADVRDSGFPRPNYDSFHPDQTALFSQIRHPKSRGIY